MRLLALLCLALAFVVPARAQESVDVQLFVNDFSLTLYIASEGVVSLADVGLRVGTDELPLLSRFAEMLDLDLSQVHTPVCIRLERYLPYGADKPPMPLDCQGIRTPRAALDPADVFWFDDGGMNTTRLLYVTLADSPINPPCPAGEARCPIAVPLVLRSLADVPVVQPAAAGEILFVLTKFRQVSGTEREPAILLAQTLDEAMQAARQRGVNVRIELVDEEIDTREQARRLADETGATVVIWGQVDPAGLDTRYEIVEREGKRIYSQIEETSFTATVSLDEVDLRIRSASEQRYVANFTVGQILYFDDQYDAAIPFFEDGLALTVDAPAAMQAALDVGGSYFYLGSSLLVITSALNPIPRLERGIAALEQVLASTPEEDYAWAAAQVNLGRGYHDLSVHTEPLANLQRAIDAYTEALRVFILADNRLEYSVIQNNLGGVYADLAIYTDPEANLARALEAYSEALLFRSPQDNPLGYAVTQNNLGNVYQELAVYRDPQANLARAVEAYTEALRFRTPDTVPLDYAMTQNNLGNTYADLATYTDSEASLARAIEAYNEALRFFTPETAPLSYAAAQNNLGTAYQKRAQYADPEVNLQRAIDAYTEALRFRTAGAAPLNYASTLNNLGVTYQELAAFIDGEANLQRAVEAYTEALRFRTPDSVPLDYAATQINLGNAYQRLGEYSDSQDDTERAIDAYSEALRFFTPEATPLDYAMTQNNLGLAYEQLAYHADPQASLALAAAAYAEALRFRTRAEMPLAYADTLGNLGLTLYLQGEIGEACAGWREATDLFREYNLPERADVFENAVLELCQPTPIPLPSPTPMLRAQAVIGQQTGTLKVGGGDVWTFEGQAGDVLNIRVNAFSPANDAENRDGLLDTLLSVYAPDGALVAEADDIEDGIVTDSELLDLELPVSGTYRIEVRSYADQTGGGYTLTIERAGS